MNGEARSSVQLVDRVRTFLAQNHLKATAANVTEAVIACGEIPGDSAVLGLVSELRSELAGSGPLEQLLVDPQVTDIMVNGAGEVWIDRGAGTELTAIQFRDEPSVRKLAQRLAAAAGRRLDDSSPFVDARLNDGSRLHAILPPISSQGTCISIRIPRRRAFSLDELTAAGSIPAEGIKWLRAVVDSRSAFLISGGTGTGKTTLLSALLSLVPEDERIIIVEDSGELSPEHPHVVQLESRPPNVEGQGFIGLRDLVRQALRMRPDRIVVGEVRGGEVVDLLAALNTGHEGGCGTVHANSADDVPARLEALALAAGLGREALHSQLSAGIDVVIHLRRSRLGVRQIAGLNILSRDFDFAGIGVEHNQRVTSEIVSSIPAVVFETDSVVQGPGYKALAKKLGVQE